MTPQETRRLQVLERRLEALEEVLIDLLNNNAHQFVGGAEWAKLDIRRIEAARR